MGVLRNPFEGLLDFLKNPNMIPICLGWVGTHLERDSVPGVSWGLEGFGCKFPNFPSLRMLFAVDLTKICLLMALLCFLPTNMNNSERGWLSREREI